MVVGRYNNMKYFLVFLFVLQAFSTSESLNLSDIGKSAVDAAKGIAEKIPDAIPSAEDLFQLGKNAIAGYPFQKVSFNSHKIAFENHILLVINTNHMMIEWKSKKSCNIAKYWII